MRFRHPDGSVVHLAYGTNVLPAQDVDGIVAQASGLGDRLRAHLDVDRVGLGMWLPATAAYRLIADPGDLERLRKSLDHHGVEVVTVNAFPHADFQGEVVKKAVYHPAWSEPERLRYTLAAAQVLAALLPDDVDRGTISTLPLGWRAPWLVDRQHAAERHLAQLAEGLSTIAGETGRAVRVGLEPEPGCAVETVDEAVARLAGVDRDWIGVCLDLCHLAVGFDTAAAALERLDEAGLAVVKAQPAAALVVDDPGDTTTRSALAAYAEDRFLHQVRQETGGRLTGRDDLPDALDGPRSLRTGRPWRVHFHVPVHADPAPPLRSSRDELRASLAALVGGPRARVHHLEVETYTWSVLPGGGPTDDDAFAAALAAELAWVRAELLDLGLTAL